MDVGNIPKIKTLLAFESKLIKNQSQYDLQAKTDIIRFSENINI